MKLLLYCVLFSGDGGQALERTGVGGEPVRILRTDGLGAAVSRVRDTDLTPEADRALTYAGVIDALFARQPVLPMRYGETFADEEQVRGHLREHAEGYERRLRELEGQVEMGIRVRVRGEELPRPAPAPPAEKQGPSSPQAMLGAPAAASGRARSSGEGAGRAYLNARKSSYALDESASTFGRQLVEQCEATLRPWFTRMKTEEAVTAGRNLALSPARVELASMYFLVPKSSVADFERAVFELGETTPAELALSGPWPPYNFAR